MLSIFENITVMPGLPSVTIHILHDNTLSTENRDKFSYIAGQYGQLVKFYNVEELCADKIEALKQAIPNVINIRTSIATFYRFFIPDILSTEIVKAIYLDSDIIVTLDINELYQIDLGDKPLGVVTEISNGVNSHSFFPLCRNSNGLVTGEDYFNASVLLMNLEIFRSEKETITNGMKFITDNPQCAGFYDQDILNYCFSKRALKLPRKFNRFMWACREDKEMTIGKKIYHLSGPHLHLDMTDPFNRMWMDYFIKTPFFDVDIIGNIYKEIIKLYDDLKGMAINISASVTGKNRAFFIEPQKLEWLKKIFSAHDDEIFLPAENKEDSITKLLDEMKSRKGKTVFFIMTVKHMGRGFPFDRLNKEGFVEGMDYVKGWPFFHGAHGQGYNSNYLVKTM